MKNDSLPGKKLTVVTTRIPHWLATPGSEISAIGIQICGHKRHENTHKTEKITEINQCEAGLVASGNPVRYEHPVHMDANG